MSDSSTSPGTVIWTREVDHDALADRWRKLGKYYGLPCLAALVIALVAGGFGAFLGVLIVLGTFSLLVVGWVFFKNVGARQNATISLVDDHIVMGNRRVDRSRIESWATRYSEVDLGVREMAVSGNPMAGDAITGRLVFRLAMYDESGDRGVRADGGPAFETEVFAWAEMSAESLERMAASIAPHIDAPRVEVDDIGG